MILQGAFDDRKETMQTSNQPERLDLQAAMPTCLDGRARIKNDLQIVPLEDLP